MRFRFKWLLPPLLALALGCALCGCDAADGGEHEHWVEEWKTVKAPACGEEGTAEGVCAGCGEEMSRALEPLQHTFTPTVVQATCTEAGYTRYTCTCGYSYDSDHTPARGHRYTKKVTAPTCGKEGFTRYTCDCGFSYVGEQTSAKGHTVTETVVPPTCEEVGYTHFACECGYAYDGDFLPPTGHTLTETVTLPTCEEEGFTHYACECGYAYDGSFTVPLGHDLTETVYPATCVDNGYTHFDCAVCEYEYDGAFVPPLGEAHVNLTAVTVYPTVNRPEGYIQYDCLDCGHSYQDDFMLYSDVYTGAYVDTTEILKQGIDTSKWNHVGYGPDGELNPLDWEALKAAGVEFVILRAGSTRGIDETFERDYLDAKAAGLEVGAYFYAYATTVEDTLADAEMLLTWLEGKQFELPIYFDMEDSSLQDLGTEVLMDLCKTFIGRLQEEGYYAALYVSNNWLYALMDTEWIKANLDVWFARYTTVDAYFTLEDREIPWMDGTPSIPGEEDMRYGIWQYTDKGTIDGFSVNFDFNFAYKDYKPIMEQWGLNGF